MALDYSGSHNLMRFPGFKLKALSLSYDDGLKTDKRLIDIMLKYGLKGTFNLNSGLADEKYRWVYKGSDVIHLNKSEMLDLYKGHEVAVHSLTHPFLEKLDDEKIYKEIYEDKCNLEDSPILITGPK